MPINYSYTYIYFIGSIFINNRNNNTNLILILVATIIYICYLYEFVKRPDIKKINLNEEHFSAPVDYKMGPYANINLNNDGRYDLYTPKYKKKKKEQKNVNGEKDLVMFHFIQR